MIHAVVGPTASGKSELAMQRARSMLAAGRGVEIVAIDAFTIYRGMDIGTAKPSATARAEVPHHLIDVLDADQDVSVAWFQGEARRIIDDLRDRDRIPLLVGGSGLYWRAVVNDLRFPPTDAATRRALEARYESRPVEAHEQLRRLDPPAADAIDPANVRRTIRALEVLELTGETFSSYQQGWDRPAPGFEDLEVTYLEPSTDTLRERIRDRAAHMVDAGLVAEAAALRARGPLSPTAAQAIGYAEAFEVLDGALDPSVLAARIASRTWRYAKRQRGWFRADPRCVPHTGDATG
jgi:tRNA dimethylallyltransferase